MNREGRGANILLAAQVAAAFALLALPTTGKVRALRALVAYLTDPGPYYSERVLDKIAEVPSDVSNLISVDAENRRLREESEERAFLQTEVESLRRENERLSAELGVRPLAGRSGFWARVLERDPVNWNNSVTIAAGGAEGVELNSPVLALHGSTMTVIGRVTEVGERTSKVLLITDPLSAVAAYIPGKGWEGLVQGQATAHPRMNYLPVESILNVGDPVATSPTSVAFPPDIPIGTVSHIYNRDPFLAFQSVEIAPSTPISTVKKVLVLSPLEKAPS